MGAAKAGENFMAKVHKYESSAIRVSFDLGRCIHAGECVRGLPAVFDPQKKPWVQPDQAEADAVAEVVGRCPTGALQFERLDGGAAEATPTENVVAIAANGPLFVKGDVELVDGNGNTVARDTRVALCRCGASENKPYCDGKHSDAGFEAASNIPDPKISGGDSGESGALKVILAENGPLVINGPVTVLDSGGDDRCSGSKTALCRCGASANKPFCDGAHSKIGFNA